MASVQHLHELMVRFDPETGAFQGAHAVDSVRTVDENDRVFVTLLDARPITKAEVGKILGAKNADLIADAHRYRQEADDAAVAALASDTHAQECESKARDTLERAERAEAQLAKLNDAVTAAKGLARKIQEARAASAATAANPA